MSSPHFWGVNLLLLVIGLLTLRDSGEAAAAKPLQRDQTEEWKGWMQIMFILYHYFAVRAAARARVTDPHTPTFPRPYPASPSHSALQASEIYNAIRIYIAAYVWMTGFGNFSYYYIRKDFTLLRFAQMMWRLNFFVFFVCATMNNECAPAGLPPRTPLHTRSKCLQAPPTSLHTLRPASPPHAPSPSPPRQVHAVLHLRDAHVLHVDGVPRALRRQPVQRERRLLRRQDLVTLAITAVL